MGEYRGKMLVEQEKVFSVLKLEDKCGLFKSGWEWSNLDLPDEFPYFDRDFIVENCRWVGMSDEVIDAFLQASKVFGNNAELHRLFWHCHYLLFRKKDTSSVNSWAMIPEGVVEYSDMFYAFVFLSGVPIIRRIHREKGIPEDISKDTLSDLELWIKEYKKRTGRWGFGQLGWLVHHFSCDIFKLGRLQFQFYLCCFDVYAYRNKRDGRVVVLACDGAEFRKDGRYNGSDRIFEEEGVWRSYYKQNEEVVVGNPFSPRGFAVNREVELKKSEWKLILQRGDPILAVHIPATGPLDHKLCGESFKQAVEFFPRYFPGFTYRAFTCSSWLLDPQLEEYLPETSNIVKFLREFYLIPFPYADDTQTFERVFGKKYEDINQAPQGSKLQRAVVEHCKKGGRWRMGAMVYFPEEVPHWGSQIYRKHPVGL